MLNNSNYILMLEQKLKKLEEENNYLKDLLNQANISYNKKTNNTKTANYELNEQIANKFFSYFWGRKDVYALRYENSNNGKHGYYPQCNNFYRQGVCPKIDNSKYNCQICTERRWKQLSIKAILEHLKGSKNNYSDVLGIYPLLPDNTCRFIVFDFDDHNQKTIHWKEEVDAVRKICKENHIPHLVEISRSGNGAHLWIFFQEFIPSEIARRFGFDLLEKGSETVNLKSFRFYDRMVPTQDKLEKGQLGNLITLPLQGKALKDNHSVFVNENWQPYSNQFDILFGTRKLDKEQIQSFSSNWAIEKAKLYPTLDCENPWEVNHMFKKEHVHGTFKIILSNYIYIDKTNLMPSLQNKIRRLAAIHNPEYYKHIAMKLSTYNATKYIYEGKDEGNYIGIPRGLFEHLLEKLEESNIPYEVIDKRECGKPIDVEFCGELREKQSYAVKKLLQSQNGILSAATAFGKTVVATAVIAQKKTSTLILLESSALIDQWEKAIQQFLLINEDLPTYTTKSGNLRKRKSLIGKIHGAHDSSTGIIDIAMSGSLFKKNEGHPLLKKYGLIIVDECHHSASKTVKRVLTTVNAKNVYGVTATPIRYDGLQKINEMLLGPIRYTYSAKDSIEEQDIPHLIYPRFTKAFCPFNKKHLEIQDAYKILRANETRDLGIINDIRNALNQGRSPVVLTKFCDHANKLYHELQNDADYVILLTGQLDKKKRNSMMKKLQNIHKSESLLLIATGQLLGEGFDYPRLDTLFLTMPVSWKGTVEQCIGRLNRNYEDKKDVIVYDYVDHHIPIFNNMYTKRLKTYHSIGYEIYTEEKKEKETINAIFNIDNYEDIYLNDILQAQVSIVIASPVLVKHKVRKLIDILKERQALGVKISVVTWHPDSYPYGNSITHFELINLIRKEGIYVHLIESYCERYAVIDNKLVWYGSMNLLGKEDIDDNIMRINSKEIAEELQLMTFSKDSRLEEL